MNGFQKFSVIAGLLLSGILSACNAVSSTPLSESTEPPSSPPTSSPVPTITITPAPTIAPTEVPLFVRPESVDDSIFKYTEEQLDAIHSGKYQEGEEVLAGWLDFWRNSQVETGETLNLEVMPLKYIYLFDIDNPENIQNIIVALESSDYPNTAILPPIDFEKSDGLSVYFKESLPYEKSGHEVPSHLMPTFLTIDANEKSVSTGKMQERFLNTTLTNKGGELVRIDSEGKVIAKIGVKQKTKEARWVRPLYKGEGKDWENFTVVGLDEIMKRQIIFDYEVQSGWVKRERDFPTNWEKVNWEKAAAYYTDPLSDLQIYLHDMYRLYLDLGNGKHQIIEVQQVDFGDMQKFLHYPKGKVDNPYLKGMLGADQLGSPGSWTADNPNFSFYGLTANDIDRDNNFYAKGGKLEKMMDEWLIVSKGEEYNDEISTVMFFSGGGTQLQ